jgi:hypothetical protein
MPAGARHGGGGVGVRHAMAQRLLPAARLARLDPELTLFVLNLGLDVLDRVAALHLERDGLAREGLDEDLHRVDRPRGASVGRVPLRLGV